SPTTGASTTRKCWSARRADRRAAPAFTKRNFRFASRRSDCTIGLVTRRGRTFARIALVLPTEYAYARAVLRGIIAATRERNLYASNPTPADGNAEPAGGRDVEALPWLFNVFRGIYGH